MKRLRTRRPAASLGLVVALLLVALAVSACARPATPAPTATSAPAPATTPPTAVPTQAAAATAPATAPAKAALDLPAGVDADGNFYRGNPDASVVLVEWSDFQ